MRAIMVMYDSLNRAYLPNYGNDLTKLPNFRRLGEQTITFDNSYVGVYAGKTGAAHRAAEFPAPGLVAD